MRFEDLTCEQKRVHLRTQLEQLGFIDTQPCITCICGRTRPIQYMYRCMDCGCFYCSRCAIEHFGCKQGYIEALCDYAWWKDGVQYVGCGVRTLQQAIDEFCTKSGG